MGDSLLQDCSTVITIKQLLFALKLYKGGYFIFSLKYTLFFRWFFAMISVSGMFAVTFSIAFAYVADCTDEGDRSTAYGLVRFTYQYSLT